MIVCMFKKTLSENMHVNGHEMQWLTQGELLGHVSPIQKFLLTIFFFENIPNFFRPDFARLLMINDKKKYFKSKKYSRTRFLEFLATHFWLRPCCRGDRGTVGTTLGNNFE